MTKNALSRRFYPSHPLDNSMSQLMRHFMGYDPFTEMGRWNSLLNNYLAESDPELGYAESRNAYVDRTDDGDEFTIWTKGSYPKLRIEKKIEDKALKGLLITAAVPGLNSDEVSVDVQKGVITIETKKKGSDEEGNESSVLLFNEIPLRHSRMEVGVNGNMDWDKITAEFLGNGLLEIFIPAIEKPKPTKVQIKEK